MASWRYASDFTSLAIALIGATQGTPPETAPPKPTEIDHPPVIAVNNVLSENQQAPSSAEADMDWHLTLVNRWNPIPENYEVNLVEGVTKIRCCLAQKECLRSAVSGA